MKRLHYYNKLKKEEREKKSPLEKVKPKKPEKQNLNRFL